MQVHGIPVDPGGLPETMRQRFAKKRSSDAAE